MGRSAKISLYERGKLRNPPAAKRNRHTREEGLRGKTGLASKHVRTQSRATPARSSAWTRESEMPYDQKQSLPPTTNKRRVDSILEKNEFIEAKISNHFTAANNERTGLVTHGRPRGKENSAREGEKARIKEETRSNDRSFYPTKSGLSHRKPLNRKKKETPTPGSSLAHKVTPTTAKRRGGRPGFGALVPIPQQW